MSNIPIPLDSFDKCKRILQEELSPEKRAVVNKLTEKMVANLTTLSGEVVLLTGKTPLICQAVALLLFHACNLTKKPGQKVIYVVAPDTLPKGNNLKVDDANIAIIDRLELIEKFDMKGLLRKLEDFSKNGGICLVPTSLDYNEMVAEYSKSVADYFFNGKIAEFALAE